MRNKMNKDQKKRKSHMELEKSSPILSRSSAAFSSSGGGNEEGRKVTFNVILTATSYSKTIIFPS